MFTQTKNSLFFRIAAFCICFFLISGQLSLSGLTDVCAQVFPPLDLTPAFTPALIKGLQIDPVNPLNFNFYIDRGDFDVSRPGAGGPGFLGWPGNSLKQSASNNRDLLKAEYKKLVKYFLAALTVPEEDLWVNLSPHERNRIVPQKFGETEMGRDLLAQDYLLKQLAASLISPDKKTGEEFWTRVRARMPKGAGDTEISRDFFSKIWIVPEKAVVYEREGSAFLAESRLKVMLEEDYLSAPVSRSHLSRDEALPRLYGWARGNRDTGELETKVIREVLLPVIEKEVNEGRTFAPLRQINDALILAAWYKQALKDELLSRIYVDQNKTAGVDIPDKRAAEKIYRQYMEALVRGVSDIIREEYDPQTGEIVPRRYFSGGYAAQQSGTSLAQKIERVSDEAMLTDGTRGRVAAYLEGVRTGKVKLDKTAVTLVEDGQGAFSRENKEALEIPITDFGAEDSSLSWTTSEHVFGTGLIESYFGIMDFKGININPASSKPDVLIIGGSTQDVNFILKRFPGAALTVVNLGYPLLTEIKEIAEGDSTVEAYQRLKLFRGDAARLYLHPEYFPDQSFDFIYAEGIDKTTYGDSADESRVMDMLRGIAKEEVRLIRPGGIIFHRYFDLSTATLENPELYYGEAIRSGELIPLKWTAKTHAMFLQKKSGGTADRAMVVEDAGSKSSAEEDAAAAENIAGLLLGKSGVDAEKIFAQRFRDYYGKDLPEGTDEILIGEFYRPFLRNRMKESPAKPETLADYYDYLSGLPNESRELQDLVSEMETSFESTNSTTGFFRDAVFYEPLMVRFLDEALMKRWRSRNPVIHVRHVASSDGQEVYTAVIYVNEGLKRLYEKLVSAGETVESFEEWRRQWVIEVDAFDRNIFNLEMVRRGVYPYNTVFPAHSEIFNDEARARMEAFFDEYFIPETGGDDYHLDGKILDIFRIAPQYIDLARPVDLTLLKQKEYDITFAANIVYHVEFDLGPDAATGILDALLETRAPDHLFIYDGVNFLTSGGKVVDIRLDDEAKEDFELDSSYLMRMAGLLGSTDPLQGYFNGVRIESLVFQYLQPDAGSRANSYARWVAGRMMKNYPGEKVRWEALLDWDRMNQGQTRPDMSFPEKIDQLMYELGDAAIKDLTAGDDRPWFGKDGNRAGDPGDEPFDPSDGKPADDEALLSLPEHAKNLRGDLRLVLEDLAAELHDPGSELGKARFSLRYEGKPFSRTLPEYSEFLETLGHAAGFNGKILYYPYGGADPFVPFTMAPSVTDVVSVGVQSFGDIGDILRFFNVMDVSWKIGRQFDGIDTIPDFERLSYQGINGIGGSAISRILSFLDGQILRISYFNLLEDGRLQFTENDSSANAVVEFLDSSGVKKRFWYISNDFRYQNDNFINFINSVPFENLLIKGAHNMWDDYANAPKARRRTIEAVILPAKKNGAKVFTDQRLPKLDYDDYDHGDEGGIRFIWREPPKERILYRAGERFGYSGTLDSVYFGTADQLIDLDTPKEDIVGYADFLKDQAMLTQTKVRVPPVRAAFPVGMKITEVDPGIADVPKEDRLKIYTTASFRTDSIRFADEAGIHEGDQVVQIGASSSPYPGVALALKGAYVRSVELNSRYKYMQTEEAGMVADSIQEAGGTFELFMPLNYMDLSIPESSQTIIVANNVLDDPRVGNKEEMIAKMFFEIKEGGYLAGSFLNDYDQTLKLFFDYARKNSISVEISEVAGPQTELDSPFAIKVLKKPSRNAGHPGVVVKNGAFWKVSILVDTGRMAQGLLNLAKKAVGSRENEGSSPWRSGELPKKGESALLSGDRDLAVTDSNESQKSAAGKAPGGIDLTSPMRHIQIRRNREGVPLPVELQDVEAIRINGFTPVIIDITPVTSLPFMLGFLTEEADNLLARKES
ncbi:MAG: hypothetical protein AB1650_07770 [Candidatus Omnitrophota bacterium]